LISILKSRRISSNPQKNSIGIIIATMTFFILKFYYTIGLENEKEDVLNLKVVLLKWG